MRIKRVFNNNVILAYNDTSEIVLFGKGIGFQKRHGDLVDKSKIEKEFILNNKEKTNIEQMFSSISKEYSDLTYKIIKLAESDLNIEFNSNIYISIMDHINYALFRAKKGLFIKNPLLWEIKRTYSKEFEAALHTIDLIKKETNIKLPIDEAATIAIHFYNAQDPSSQINASMKSVEVISSIVKIISNYFKIEFDDNDLNFNRLMIHLRYFVNSIVNKVIIDKTNADDCLYESLKKQYPDVNKCVEQVNRFIELKMNKTITNEEKVYLMIHIQRIVDKEKNKEILK